MIFKIKKCLLYSTMSSPHPKRPKFSQIREGGTRQQLFFINQNFTAFFTKRATEGFDYYIIVSKEEKQKIRRSSSQLVRRYIFYIKWFSK